MIQLTRNGLVGSAGRIDELAATFERTHCVTLPGFLEPLILRRLATAIEHGTFEPRVHDEVDPPATDLWLTDPAIRGTLLFLFNDPSLFEFIRQLTGCAPVGCFIGSVYRLTADAAHTTTWHDDIYDGRMVGLSLNLSPDGFRGGLLQIRETQSKRIVHEVANTGFGDAIVFRLSPRVEHVITRVLQGPAKTAYAGWFKAYPERGSFIRHAAGHPAAPISQHKPEDARAGHDDPPRKEPHAR